MIIVTSHIITRGIVAPIMTNHYDPYIHDEDLNKLRQQRLQELKKEATLSTETYGQLTPVSREQELVHMLTNTGRLVIHFSMPTFRRCNIMSEHLQKLAVAYPKTRFVEVRADEMHFLVEKFKIQVLPCLAIVIFSQLADK